MEEAKSNTVCSPAPPNHLSPDLGHEGRVVTKTRRRLGLVVAFTEHELELDVPARLVREIGLQLRRALLGYLRAGGVMYTCQKHGIMDGRTD